LTYFELDELINDYEVTTVSGLIMTELSYSKTGRKIDLAKFELGSSIWMA
jgi:putative hemolysin